MAMFFPSALLIVLLFQGYHSIDWTSGPKNGTALYACVGDDVIMPWTYALATGDVLHDIQWLYQGQSQEVIAIFSHGAFLPLPAFANRVQLVANGGLQLSHVTKSDRGTYAVEITGADISNNHIILQKHLKLEIADGLMTSDRQLHVTMNPIPVLDNVTNTYSVQLQCGQFIFQHQPPFDVKWVTPSGSLHGSSHYKNGQFYYLLPPQAKGGNYTCRVPAHTVGTCVARDIEASVAVDAMDIRLALMEARLTAADTERKQLEARLTAADTERKQLQVQHTDTTAKLAAADIERRQLQGQLNATTAELVAIQQRSKLVVSFHAGHLLTSSFVPGDHLILPTVYTNQGNGYNNNTGIFTAPVSGTYCFIASTGTTSSSHMTRAGLYIMHEDFIVGYANVFGGDSFDMASGHAVIHMLAGDVVWLKASNTATYWRETTWFSGVLISPDP